jgi:hypothetical protein
MARRVGLGAGYAMLAAVVPALVIGGPVAASGVYLAATVLLAGVWLKGNYGTGE